MHSLIRHWRECNTNHSPYYYPGDEVVLTNDVVLNLASMSDYINSPVFGKRDDASLHVGLLPMPYMGDLMRARAVILMLNPGLKPIDYFAEWGVSSLDGIRELYRNALIENLRQGFRKDNDFPFVLLNPQFSWHSGFIYWEKRFQDIVKLAAEKHSMAYTEGLSWVSRQVAAVELLPYHARTFHFNRKVPDTIPSVQDACSFVKDVLVPKARNGDLVLIVARAVKQWRLPRHRSIIEYTSGEARGASLSLRTKGGKAIARQLGL